MAEVHFVARRETATRAAEALRTRFGVRAGDAGVPERGWPVTVASTGKVIGSHRAFNAAAGREFLRCDDPLLVPASIGAA
jgi:hypothetical protein